MKMTAQAYRTARKALERDHILVWYILPDQAAVIGCAVQPGETANELPAQDVQITMLDAPVAGVTCTLKRAAKGEDLFWIVAKQGAGSVWYRWTAPDGTAHNFVAHADAEADTTIGRQSTNDRTRRLQMIWKLMHRFQRSYEVVDRVCEGVGNRLNTATVAFRLLEKLLEEHDHNQNAVREELKRLQGLETLDRHLLRRLQTAGAESPSPDTVATILRGALLAVERNDT